MNKQTTKATAPTPAQYDIPLDQALSQDSKVKSWVASKIQPQADILNGIAARLAPIIHDCRSEVTYINLDQDLSHAARNRKDAEVRQAALGKIDAVQAAATAAIAALDDEIAQAQSLAPKDVQEHLLQEIQQQRAWARVVRILDARPELTDKSRALMPIMEQAAADRDLATIGALMAEIPAYFTAHRGGNLAERCLAQLKSLAAPLLPPLVRGAMQVEAAIGGAWARARQAIDLARADVTGPMSGSCYLPGMSAVNDLNITKD